MQPQILEQLYSFFIFILVGFLIGILFDFFRISRKTFKTSDIITSLEDIAFWIISGSLILFSIFKFNNGDLRIYILVGICIGITLYMLIFSKIVINVLVNVILFIKKIIISLLKLIIYPFKTIYKFLKQIIKPVKKIQIILTKKLKTPFNLIKNKNKSKFKKDFV